jgi:U32 family peptidase
VAYSGQCLTSEALGGRSANRGECAQACRMPYDLIADGRPVPLGDRKYLLSPRDLAGLDLLPSLARAGVASLKIEGRLKTPEYVASITRIYREAIEDLRSAITDSRTPTSDPKLKTAPNTTAELPLRKADTVNRKSKYEMEMAFSRGLHTGWLEGVNNQQLVHARFGKKRGVYLGTVSSVGQDLVVVLLESSVKPGDGVVFDAGKPAEDEQGGRVYEVRRKKEELKSEASHPSTNNPQPTILSFGHGDVNFSRIHVGDRVWKTSDPELDRRLRKSFEGDAPKFMRPLSIEVRGAADQPLTVFMRDELGHLARVESTMPLVTANKQGLTVERLREQLGRLGGTAFTLGEFKSLLPGNLMLPVSELNRLRREGVAELERLRAQPRRWTLNSISACGVKSKSEPPDPGEPELIVLVRSMAQLEAAVRCELGAIYCELEDPKKYRDAVALFRKSQIANRKSEIWVAPPRIFKTGEEWVLQQVRSCNADGYLVRNYDHLRFFAGERCRGDYSLNIANRLSAEYFKNRFGLERLTASYDLNFQQLESLLVAAPPGWFEVTLHQHMPMFHMEHCVFCAFLSNGTDYTNCGRPCDRLEVKLRDRVGAEHPVKADAGCRNTVFNALPQTGAEHAARMIALGVRHFRIEFLNEAPEQVTHTISKYRQLLRGEISGGEVWRELKLINQLGVTRGTNEARVKA